MLKVAHRKAQTLTTVGSALARADFFFIAAFRMP